MKYIIWADLRRERDFHKKRDSCGCLAENWEHFLDWLRGSFSGFPLIIFPSIVSHYFCFHLLPFKAGMPFFTLSVKRNLWDHKQAIFWRICLWQNSNYYSTSSFYFGLKGTHSCFYSDWCDILIQVMFNDDIYKERYSILCQVWLYFCSPSIRCECDWCL